MGIVAHPRPGAPMPRPLRHCHAHYAAEITGRTLFGLFRLAPTPLLMKEIIGIFAKAQKK
jgi:hypothetical protein